jgi:AraC family transcriptional activator of pobA
METISVDDFYKNTASKINKDVESLLPAGINKEIGHFNVFSLADLVPKMKADPGHMPYNRRAY